MPLPEAAQRLYAENIDKPFGKTCRAVSSVQDELIGLCGIFIKERLPIYGKRLLGPGPLQRISEEDSEHLFLVSGASALSKNAMGTMVVFTDICIPRSKFQKFLKNFDGEAVGLI
jgi:hypothetical protein